MNIDSLVKDFSTKTDSELIAELKELQQKRKQRPTKEKKPDKESKVERLSARVKSTSLLEDM